MRIYNQDELSKIHHHCMFNKVKLLDSKLCGCFSCEEVFPVSEITNWTDRGRTAICPFCGIDSILSDTAEYPITQSLLNQLYKKYFEYLPER